MDKVIENWDKILQTVKADYDVGDVAFNTWLKPLKVYDVRDHVITILVPSEQVVLINLLNKKYKLLLQVTICEITGMEECEVKFISPDEAPKKEVSSYDNTSASTAMSDIDRRCEEAHLNPKYIFDTFIVGNNNKFAQAAALAKILVDGHLYHFCYLFSVLFCEIAYVNRKSGLRLFLLRQTVDIALPVALHDDVYGDGFADILRVVTLGKENVEHLLLAGRVHDRDACPVADLAQHLITVAQLRRRGHGGKVGVVDHTRDLQVGMDLHLLLQSNDLVHRAGERAADIDHVQDLQLLRAHGHEVLKVLIIAAEGRGTDGVTADVEHDGVPVHGKCRSDLCRQGQRLHAGAGIVRRDETNLFLLHELAALRQAEVGIDQVQVNEFCLSGFSRFKSKIQRKLTLAAAVVANHDIYLFQNDAPPLEGYLKCANGY